MFRYIVRDFHYYQHSIILVSSEHAITKHKVKLDRTLHGRSRKDSRQDSACEGPASRYNPPPTFQRAAGVPLQLITACTYSMMTTVHCSLPRMWPRVEQRHQHPASQGVRSEKKDLPRSRFLIKRLQVSKVKSRARRRSDDIFQWHKGGKTKRLERRLGAGRSDIPILLPKHVFVRMYVHTALQISLPHHHRLISPHHTAAQSSPPSLHLRISGSSHPASNQTSTVHLY